MRGMAALSVHACLHQMPRSWLGGWRMEVVCVQGANKEGGRQWRRGVARCAAAAAACPEGAWVCPQPQPQPQPLAAGVGMQVAEAAHLPNPKRRATHQNWLEPDWLLLMMLFVRATWLSTVGRI